MGKFVNPFTDVGFKKIFGQEVNKDLLISFLNSLILGNHEIVDLQFLDKEKVAQDVEEKRVIYDIYCKTSDGKRIIVEMQNRWQPLFIDRAIYYVASAICQQVGRGKEYEYDAVYAVCFMNFIENDLPDKLRTDMVLADKETNAVLSDRMHFIFLQLPFFDKEESECENYFERWIYVLKNMSNLSRMPWAVQDGVFAKLAEIADVERMTDKERRAYDETLKIYRDYYGTLNGAYIKGKEKGIEKGREERTIEMARNMKAAGVDASTIQTVSGLSAEEIAKL